MKLTVLFVLALAWFTPVKAQKYFEGVITYTVHYDNLTSTLEGQEHLLPGQLKLYCKDGLYRVEHLGMNQARIQLVDQITPESIVLLDLLGEHVALRTPSAQLKEEQAKNNALVVKKNGGKINVAGYSCSQVLLCDVNGQNCISQVAYCPSLKGTFPEMPEFKGLPLKFDMQHEELTAHYEASTVEQIKLDRVLFSVPDGYTTVNTNEMKKLFNSILPVALEGEVK
jgi:hypothetical protein